MYSPDVAAELRRRGHDAIHVSELGLAGRSDADVLAAAAAEGRAFVTNNIGDYIVLFKRLVDEGNDHFGILLTSDRSLPRNRRAIGLYVRVLDELMRANPSDDAFRNQLRWLTPD
jgi:hypothetical protein